MDGLKNCILNQILTIEMLEDTLQICDCYVLNGVQLRVVNINEIFSITFVSVIKNIWIINEYQVRTESVWESEWITRYVQVDVARYKFNCDWYYENNLAATWIATLNERYLDWKQLNVWRNFKLRIVSSYWKYCFKFIIIVLANMETEIG